MKKHILNYSWLLILIVSFTFCSQDTGSKRSIIQPINPNGDSELALLMRSMYEDLDSIKKQLERGDSTLLSLNHEKILSAHATEPHKAASPEYKAFAAGYLNLIEALDKAQQTDQILIYESLVESCINCHQSLCPGPIVKINKLKEY